MPMQTTSSTLALNLALAGHDELTRDIRVAHAWRVPRVAELMRPVAPPTAFPDAWAGDSFIGIPDGQRDDAYTNPAVSPAWQAADVYTFAAYEWLSLRYRPLAKELSPPPGTDWAVAVMRAIRHGKPLTMETLDHPPAVWCSWLKPATTALEPIESAKQVFDHWFGDEPVILAALDRRYQPIFSHALAVVWHPHATRDEILEAVRAKLEEINHQPRLSGIRGKQPGRSTEVIRYLRLYTLWRTWQADHPYETERAPFHAEILRRAEILSGSRPDDNGERAKLARAGFPWDDPGKVSTPDTVEKALRTAEPLCKPYDGPDLDACYRKWYAMLAGECI